MASCIRNSTSPGRAALSPGASWMATPRRRVRHPSTPARRTKISSTARTSPVGQECSRGNHDPRSAHLCILIFALSFPLGPPGWRQAPRLSLQERAAGYPVPHPMTRGRVQTTSARPCHPRPWDSPPLSVPCALAARLTIPGLEPEGRLSSRVHSCTRNGKSFNSCLHACLSLDASADGSVLQPRSSASSRVCTLDARAVHARGSGGASAARARGAHGARRARASTTARGR